MFIIYTSLLQINPVIAYYYRTASFYQIFMKNLLYSKSFKG